MTTTDERKTRGKVAGICMAKHGRLQDTQSAAPQDDGQGGYSHPPGTEFFFRGRMYGCPKGVYFPSEDSYFLAEKSALRPGCTAIDMGCGSGIQSLNALLQGAAKVVAVDINAGALNAAKKNCESAGFGEKICTLESDLFGKFPGKADLIVFNPPYVESEGMKFVDLDGGKKGRKVLDRFLAEMPKHLNKGGRCFFLQTDLNGHRQTGKALKKAGLEYKIIGKKKGFFEELAVYECWRK